MRLVGVTFFALAAYLTAQGIRDLVTGARPAASPADLAITARSAETYTATNGTWLTDWSLASARSA